MTAPRGVPSSLNYYHFFYTDEIVDVSVVSHPLCFYVLAIIL